MSAPFTQPALCLCTITFIWLGSVAQADAADTAPTRLGPEKLVQDFGIARRALEEAHSGIYRYAPKSEMDRIFEQAQKRLDQPMSVVEFYRIVAPVVAAVKCGHTGVQMPSGTVEGPILPLRVRILDGKLYVVRHLSSEGGRLAGMEISSINGVPAAKIIKTLVAATAADGDVESSRFYRLGGWNFSRQLRDLTGIVPPFNLVLRGVGQQDTRVRLDGQMRDKLTESWQAKFPQDRRPKEAASLRYVDDGAIAILKINGFGGRVGGPKPRPLGQFISDSFAEFQSKKTATLILDLRDNGGGADELGKLLLSYLIDEPFRYYDDLVINALSFSFSEYISGRKTLPSQALERRPNGKYRMVKHPNWGIQPPSKPTFRGKVYILTNGGSFSTTSEFLSHVHFRKRATFIGEESAGGYYGNTSGAWLRVVLPNSKLVLSVPVMTYYVAVKDNPAAAHGIVPDYPVGYTIAELLSGQDKEMELALKLARKK